MPRLNARGLKCILVLFPDEVVALGDVPTPRVTLTIEAADMDPSTPISRRSHYVSARQ